MLRRAWSLRPGQGWGPVELGQTRRSIVEYLYQDGIEFAQDQHNPEWLDIREFGAELYFTSDEDPILWQIACDDGQQDVNGKPVIGKPLSDALLAFQVQQFKDTLWTLDEDVVDDLELAAQPAAPAQHHAAGEELVIGGVLWIVSLGIGLRLDRGVVRQVFLRRPQSVPRQGCGPLTEQHLQLVIREDLSQHLPAYERQQRMWSPLRMVATIGLIFSVAGTAILAGRQQLRWQAAPRAAGTVIEIEHDNVPGESPVYVVEYQDARGASHRVRWTLADLYVPREVGETVDVAYLSDAPDRPLAPARLGDVGFVRYAPVVVALVIGYAVIVFIDHRRRARKFRDT